MDTTMLLALGKDEGWCHLSVESFRPYLSAILVCPLNCCSLVWLQAPTE